MGDRTGRSKGDAKRAANSAARSKIKKTDDLIMTEKNGVSTSHKGGDGEKEM